MHTRVPLSVHACICDVTRERCCINVNTTTEQLLQFQNDMKGSLRVEVVSSEYCKTVVTQVPLYCYCMTPWIQGSTSVAIYGSKQKEFNVHNCCKCDNWFHEFCLKAAQ